jgi:hypothetical protein
MKKKKKVVKRSKQYSIGGYMIKRFAIIFTYFFAVSLFAQEVDVEKKIWDIYSSDMPKDVVGTVKIMKKIGKIYEGVKKYDGKFEPSAVDKERGYSIFIKSYMDNIYPNMIPTKDEIRTSVSCYAALGEKEPVVVVVYPLEDMRSIKLIAGDLREEGGGIIPKSNIEIGYIRYDYEPEGLTWYCKGKYVMPFNETHGKKETPRAFLVTVVVPEEVKGGIYKGKLTVIGGRKNTDIDYIVEVLPFKFKPFTDEYYFGAFTYLSANTDPAWLEKIILDLKKYGMNIIHSNIRDVIKVTANDVKINFTNIEKHALLMKKYGFKKWIVEMTGLPNAFVDALGCKYYDERFNRAYKSMLKQIKDKMEEGGWPEIQIMYDEPREFDSDNQRPLARTYWDMENLLKLHNEVGLAALPTYMSDSGGKRFDDKGKEAEYWRLVPLSKYNMTHGWEKSKKIIEETVKYGKVLYLYNCGFGRYQFGLFTYQLNARGNVQFWYSGGNYFNTMAQFPTSYAVLTIKDGPFVPVLRWIRSAEGVDDFRYIYTLEKLIEESKDKNSTDVLKAKDLLKEIKNFKFDKSSARGEESDTVSEKTLKKFSGFKLDEFRYRLAQSIIALNKQIK